MDDAPEFNIGVISLNEYYDSVVPWQVDIRCNVAARSEP
jgi:hypothetical protein